MVQPVINLVILGASDCYQSLILQKRGKCTVVLEIQMCTYPAMFPASAQKGFLQKEEPLGVRLQCSQKIESLGLRQSHKCLHLLCPTVLTFHFTAEFAKEPASLVLGLAEICFFLLDNADNI